MSLVIQDELLASQVRDQRRARGLDRFDEVWDGVYVVVPIANNEHQSLASQLTIAIGAMVDWNGLGETMAGANVSDRQDDWTKNYRVPDVLVFLKDTAAENRDTHWFGGPDFAIEVTSPGDRTLEKLEFYAAVKTRELLVIDRDPWQLTLYRLQGDPPKLAPVAVSSFSQVATVQSEVIPVAFRIEPTDSCICVRDSAGAIARDISIQPR